MGICLLGICCLSTTLFAQDGATASHNINIKVEPVALVDIEPSANADLTMNFTLPTEAGDKISAPADNNTLWLNYSSILTASAQTRTISVALTALIPGIDIKVLAGGFSGIGKGTTGSPSAQLTLGETGKDIISGIGSCFTGDGINNGHQLTYNVSANDDNYGDIIAFENAATVTYTM